MLVFLSIIGALVCMFLGSIWAGYVLTILWGWFIVPVFALPALTFIQAIGLSLVTHFLTVQYIPDNSNEDSTKKLIGSLVFSFVYSTMALFVGWIFHMFM